MGKNTNKRYDLVVIGAGASGMMAAITATRAKQTVCVIEKLDKAGKKLYATGNGKCNFTNEVMTPDCFYGDKTFIEHVLEEFSVQNCLDFFHSIGICAKSKNGYLYPNSEQAGSIVTALVQEMERLNVKTYFETQVQEIVPDYAQVEVYTNKGCFIGKRVIIATGLLASPKLGSDGSLFEILKGLGHRFSPILPTLCGYYCKGMPFKKVSGVRAQGRVSAMIDGKVLAADTGEIQFTEYGLSGIPVFQISHVLSKGLYEKAKVEIAVNLLPDFEQNELLCELEYRRNLFAEQTMEYFLNGLINQKLGDYLLEKTRLDRDMFVSSLSDADLYRLCENLQSITVNVTKYRDYEFAQVCMGGIPVSDISIENLESAIVPNLHFTGEILDVDGICGGYNLHFAWATGYIAGKNCK